MRLVEGPASPKGGPEPVRDGALEARGRSGVVLYAELLAQSTDLGEHGRQLLGREPELRAALQELAQRLGPQHSPVAVAGVVELADREGAEVRDALERAHQGRAGLRLAVGGGGGGAGGGPQGGAP